LYCCVDCKLINYYNKLKLRLRSISDTTEQFEITSGVKQGDPLSALLFSIVMDILISKLEARDSISARLKQILACANDSIIIGRTKQVIIDKVKVMHTRYRPELA
jgi:hypothetical protein